MKTFSVIFPRIDKNFIEVEKNKDKRLNHP